MLHVNYHPSWPHPNLTFGVPPHVDPNGIIFLMQGDVNSLQVLKNVKWVSVEPIPNAFVVVSNGRFTSAEHGAVTNTSNAQMSIPTFYGPSMDAFIAEYVDIKTLCFRLNDITNTMIRRYESTEGDKILEPCVE
ncbi:hypothetical protein KI387_015752, partial [Taxus chinensis]